MDSLEKLLAIEEIKQLKARYFRAMDTKDWELFRALFTEDVVVDVTEAFIPQDHAGKPIEADHPRREPDPGLYFEGIDAFMAAQRRSLDGVSTVHHGHTPEIEILSDTEARGIWAMEDKLRWPPGSAMRALHGYGHYRETYVRTGHGWLIKALKLTRVRIDVAEA